MMQAVGASTGSRLAPSTSLGGGTHDVAAGRCSLRRACVETSREPDLRADFAGRMKWTIPPPAVATMGTTRVVRSRLVRPDIARAPHGGDPGDTYVAVSGDGRTRLVRSTALRDV